MVSNTKDISRSIFLTLCVMGFFAILSSTMSKNPVLSPFATSLGTPADMTGFVAAASTIPGILVSLPVASLSDIYGRKKFLIMSCAIFATAPFLYLLITVWWQLILVRFYHGFATAIFVPVAEASLAELFPTQRAERISVFTSATYVGRGIAPFLGGYLLFLSATPSDPLFNYHLLYAAVGAVGLVAFILSLVFLSGRKQSMISVHERPTKLRQLYSGWGILVKNRSVVMVSFVQAVLYYSYGTVEYFISGYLKDTLHFDFFSTALVSGGLIALAIFARPYMGRVSDRAGRRKPIIFGLLVSAVPLLAIPFSSSLPMLLLLALVYSFGFASVNASTPALMCELAPKQFVGTSMGFLDTVMDIGQTLGPIASGFILSSVFQYVGLFWTLSIILIVTALFFVVSGTGKVKEKCDSTLNKSERGSTTMVDNDQNTASSQNLKVIPLFDN
ncbi:MAG TPA: MFS transporter [Candidatus Bathyarchaeia archaeon]|nr:MFS transporter [Candidatus Bathyarchaeia archaeon]